MSQIVNAGPMTGVRPAQTDLARQRIESSVHVGLVELKPRRPGGQPARSLKRLTVTIIALAC